MVDAQFPQQWRFIRQLSGSFARLPSAAWCRAHGLVWRGPPAAKGVALTFDDGPDGRWTPQILKALDEVGARATFFLIGSRILAEPTLAREIADRHEIGTHLFSHRRGLMRRRESFQDEVRAALDAHVQVLGATPKWLRFPFGDVGRVTPADWRKHGLRACHWSLNSRDSRAASAGEVLRRIEPRLRPGEIVLLHDGLGADSRLGPGHRQATVDALPKLLESMCRQELPAVSLSELGGPMEFTPTLHDATGPSHEDLRAV